MLPYIDGRSIMRTQVRTGFGALNHNLSAGDGEFFDMENLSGREYPLLTARPQRGLVRTLTKPNGAGAMDAAWWADGTSFFYDGARKGTVEDSSKQYAVLGHLVLIFPDKAFYDFQTDTFGSLEARKSVSGPTFRDGTYAGEPAAANTIYKAGAAWGSTFSVGDAVTISGCTVHPENNGSFIVREIDGDELRFYENSFTLTGTSYAEAGTVTLSRGIPDLDYVCVNENRVWGCKGDGIYASKLGDPFNWNSFDGLSTDSWAAEVVDAGDFTGCVSYQGYPTFFKENSIYKIQGDKPANFAWSLAARFGVSAGSARSLAVAGETLFYLSRVGVCAYTGGFPQIISGPLGVNAAFSDGVAGSDGIRYYISMREGETYSLYVFDTRYNTWHREDDSRADSFYLVSGGLYMIEADGKTWRLDGTEGDTEEPVAWYAETADFTRHYETSDTNSEKNKGLLSLRIRCALDRGTVFSVYVQYDSDGEWHRVETLHGSAVKKSYNLPMILRRCDHYRLRFTGTGGFLLYSLAAESYSGSKR